MDRRKLPLVLMLIAGAITSITVYFRGLGLKTMLIALLAALVAFYLLGTIIKLVLDSFETKNQEAALDEGAVIEKEADEKLPSENGESERGR